MPTSALTFGSIYSTKRTITATWRCLMRNPNHAVDVGTELGRYRLLRDHLLGQIPHLDEETLADTLEGITDLRELLAELVRSALEDEALSYGLSTRLAEMKGRAQR